MAYHRTGGNGPALVLSHGLTDNGLCWTRLATALAPEFDVIMLDARGHGASARITADHPQNPASDIGQAIDQLGLASPIVMGHSVGARATATYANANPGRVSKVILEDPPFVPPAEPGAAAARRAGFRRQVEKYRSMPDAEIVARGKATSPLWHDDEFPAWAAAKKQVDAEAMPHYDRPWQDAIDRIAAPTLLIHGDPKLGSLITPEIAAEAVSINLKIRPLMISGAGHNTRRENFPEFLAAVQHFLRAP